MELTIILFFYLFVIIFDLSPLLKKASKKEKGIYYVILIFTIGILLLDSINVTVPSPAVFIKNFINSFL